MVLASFISFMSRLKCVLQLVNVANKLVLVWWRRETWNQNTVVFFCSLFICLLSLFIRLCTKMIATRTHGPAENESQKGCHWDTLCEVCTFKNADEKRVHMFMKSGHPVTCKWLRTGRHHLRGHGPEHLQYKITSEPVTFTPSVLSESHFRTWPGHPNHVNKMLHFFICRFVDFTSHVFSWRYSDFPPMNLPWFSNWLKIFHLLILHYYCCG